MRKLQDTVRFPQSIQLFRFCFRVLELRKPNNKIHAQDLGAILNFNPSDTSHWKKGKKAIRNPQYLENLSKFLDIELETVQDLAEGVIDFDEAYSDFTDAEEFKKLAQEEPKVRIERRDKNVELEKIAREILEHTKISTMPIHIPDLVSSFPFIQLLPGDVVDKLARSSRIKPGYYAIRFRKGDIRAHTRLAIAREIARILLLSERDKYNFSKVCEVLTQAEIIDFANALLIPRSALAVEIQKISTRENLVKALAELFWVPKSAVRQRLASILLETAPESVFVAPEIDTQLNTPEYQETSAQGTL